MKSDEIELLIRVARSSRPVTPREIIASMSIPPRRAHYLLDKWAGKGWYEYGVTLDLDWLTEAGKTAASKFQLYLDEVLP